MLDISFLAPISEPMTHIDVIRWFIQCRSHPPWNRPLCTKGPTPPFLFDIISFDQSSGDIIWPIPLFRSVSLLSTCLSLYSLIAEIRWTKWTYRRNLFLGLQENKTFSWILFLERVYILLLLCGAKIQFDYNGKLGNGWNLTVYYT